MARPQKRRCICSVPMFEGFQPVEKADLESSGTEKSDESVIQLTYDEYEAIRLIDFLKMTQEQCAKKMDISRPTVTRIYEEARGKIADMFVNGKKLVIGGGDVTVCTGLKPECVNEPYCCHRRKA